MAGPVPSYLTTQTAAQTAFTVPFGLLSFVNSAIATATAAGEFNVTVDCSLFVTENVSNLRIYLDSLGYNVEFAKDTNNKSLNIDWGRFLDVPGTEIVVDQGTTPWIIAGTVDQGAAGSNPWPVADSPSTSAVVSTVTVTMSSTVLLGTNLGRRGFIIQCKTSPIYVILGSTASTSTYSYYLLKLNALEINNYYGPVAAIVDSGSAVVQVTEKV